MKIIDAHSHMITTTIAEGMGIKSEDKFMKECLEDSVQKHTKAWLEAMDRHGIEKTVFMATQSLHKDFIEFINSSERFVGFAKIDPTVPNALKILKKEFKSGMRGVKIYATNDAVDVGSKKAYPFYEYCQENAIPITIHFGVTIGKKSNLMMGNPLLLSRVLKDFPKLNFVIAHFGAGFFREVLMLSYKANNLFVDTSGTNNWLACQDNFLTLQDVFKKTLEALGPQKLIFGTDTRIFPDGYRKHILGQQMQILDDLKLSVQEKEDIIYGNAKRVFGI